jgi:hypothetical protein
VCLGLVYYKVRSRPNFKRLFISLCLFRFLVRTECVSLQLNKDVSDYLRDYENWDNTLAALYNKIVKYLIKWSGFKNKIFV